MQADLVALLDGIGSWAFHTAVTLFLLLNVAAVALVVIMRDRRMVDRWTPRWLAANLGLLGLGAGVPLVTALMRAGLSLLPTFGSTTSVLPK
jgi:hypothetical protein